MDDGLEFEEEVHTLRHGGGGPVGDAIFEDGQLVAVDIEHTHVERFLRGRLSGLNANSTRI